mmetsp:Transcript_10291/g.17264  ORF Transcript_10291/g.17264 Transcript_10291/m.17264 type:complete len:304 (-) Transcript_10291:307-1218(-)
MMINPENFAVEDGERDRIIFNACCSFMTFIDLFDLSSSSSSSFSSGGEDDHDDSSWSFCGIYDNPGCFDTSSSCNSSDLSIVTTPVPEVEEDLMTLEEMASFMSVVDWTEDPVDLPVNIDLFPMPNSIDIGSDHPPSPLPSLSPSSHVLNNEGTLPMGFAPILRSVGGVESLECGGDDDDDHADAKVETTAIFLEDFDVIWGRSTCQSDRHPGNMRFRSLIDHHRAQYKSSKDRVFKARIVNEVMKEVASWTPGGRFVKQEDHHQQQQSSSRHDFSGSYCWQWVLVPEEDADEKVRKALRRVE